LTEDWRDVVGFPGYQVSSLGRFRSWRRCKRPGHPPSLLALNPGTNGYPQVSMMRDGKSVVRAAHEYVLTAFAGPRPPGTEARHYPDRNKTNICAANLSWATRRLNLNDRVEHGTLPSGERHGRRTKPWRTARGERHGMASLTECKVDTVLWMLSCSINAASIARVFGVGHQCIRYIRSGKSWKHVPRLYPLLPAKGEAKCHS
jgi:hypothetical protein